MRTNRFLAAVGVSVGLMAGGVTAVVLGVPGVSGAQTTETTPPSTTAPTPDGTAPAPDGTRPRAPRGENCPEKDGAAGAEGTGAPATGSATPLRFSRSGGGRV